eukprot:3841851-Pleurochrysis_carterae.AAC.1
MLSWLGCQLVLVASSARFPSLVASETVGLDQQTLSPEPARPSATLQGTCPLSPAVAAGRRGLSHCPRDASRPGAAPKPREGSHDDGDDVDRALASKRVKIRTMSQTARGIRIMS